MGAEQQASELPNRGTSTQPQLLTLQRLFEELGLTSYEARLLVALVRVGEATAAQLAQLTGIGRPNVYLRLESLAGRGLAEARLGKVTRWVSPGATEVVNRLREVNEDQLSEARAKLVGRCEEARQVLDDLGPEMPKVPTPHVQLLSGELQSSVLYERLITEVEREVLVANRGPYPGELDVDPGVIEALERGVQMRALYRRAELEDPEAWAVRRCAEEYQAAGVGCRVVDDVPLGIAVFDQATVLVSLPRLAEGADPFPTNFVVDHPGFGVWCAAAFEQAWSTGDALSLSASAGPANRRAPTRPAPPLRVAP